MYWPSPVRRRWSSAARMPMIATWGRDPVGVGDARTDRRKVGPSRDSGHASRRLQGETEASEPRVRSGLALHRHRAHDHVGFDLADCLVVEAESVHESAQTTQSRCRRWRSVRRATSAPRSWARVDRHRPLSAIELVKYEEASSE